MATIGVEKKVALETTRKSAPGKRKKTRLLKDDIDNACKNMKMLATALGLNNATKVIVTAVEADSIHLDAFAIVKSELINYKNLPSADNLRDTIGELDSSAFAAVRVVSLRQRARLVLLSLNTVIPAFIALLTGEFFTCCKRIRRGDSMISFLLELA